VTIDLPRIEKINELKRTDKSIGGKLTVTVTATIASTRLEQSNEQSYLLLFIFLPHSSSRNLHT